MINYRFFSVLWREMLWGCNTEYGLFWHSLYWASQAAPLNYPRHTASPQPNSDVTVKWSLLASTNKIFEHQRFKTCLSPSRLNSFMSDLWNNLLCLTLETESCSSGNCTVQAQWCQEHTPLGLMTQHQLSHRFCLVPVTQSETLGVTPGVRWHLLGLHKIKTKEAHSVTGSDSAQAQLEVCDLWFS